MRPQITGTLVSNLVSMDVRRPLKDLPIRRSHGFDERHLAARAPAAAPEDPVLPAPGLPPRRAHSLGPSSPPETLPAIHTRVVSDCERSRLSLSDLVVGRSSCSWGTCRATGAAVCISRGRRERRTRASCGNGSHCQGLLRRSPRAAPRLTAITPRGPRASGWYLAMVNPCPESSESLQDQKLTGLGIENPSQAIVIRQHRERHVMWAQVDGRCGGVSEMRISSVSNLLVV